MLKVSCIWFLLYFVNIMDFSEPYRILAVYPMPSLSHQLVFRSLTQALLKRGHEIVVITPDPEFPKDSAPENLTEIDVHDLSYNMWAEYTSKLKGDSQDHRNGVKSAVELGTIIFEEQLKSEEVQKLINCKEKQFDVLLLELMVRPALIFSHIYRVPVIQVSSFGGFHGLFELIGGDSHPFFYPICTQLRLNDNTFWGKISELYSRYGIDYDISNLEKFENEMLERVFGQDTPQLSVLKNNIHMVFLNSYSIWESNRPVPPNVFYLGCMQIKEKKEIPEDLKKYLESSENGVIFISFGSNVRPSLLPTAKIQMFMKVFSELPYNVLWKWDSDDYPAKIKNIQFSKWFPQSDLLRHPKVRLFITQGGLQSTDEAIAGGVPLIGFPIFADQFFNTEQYVHHKIGIKLNIETVTEDELRNAIKTIVENDSYRKNINELRTLMYDQPQTPLERAVWWTEYLLRHKGAKHLRASTFNMSWTQYYQVELVLMSMAAFTSVLLILYAFKRLLNTVLTPKKIKRN